MQTARQARVGGDGASQMNMSQAVVPPRGRLNHAAQLATCWEQEQEQLDSCNVRVVQSYHGCRYDLATSRHERDAMIVTPYIRHDTALR